VVFALSTMVRKGSMEICSSTMNDVLMQEKSKEQTGSLEIGKSVSTMHGSTPSERNMYIAELSFGLFQSVQTRTNCEDWASPR
jgi:hypothetical protein